MKLYVTLTSPYARLARILVVEKRLQGQVEIIEAKTCRAAKVLQSCRSTRSAPSLRGRAFGATNVSAKASSRASSLALRSSWYRTGW